MHIEMENRMKRVMDKERYRIQTLEKEKFNRKYLLLVNEQKRERKRKRKRRKRKKLQNNMNEEKINCNFLPCFFSRSTQIDNGENENNIDSDDERNENCT